VLHFVEGLPILPGSSLRTRFCIRGRRVAAIHSSAWMALVDRYRNITLPVFLGVLVAICILECAEVPDRVGVHSGPAWLCRLPRWPSSYWLVAFGKYICHLPDEHNGDLS